MRFRIAPIPRGSLTHFKDGRDFPDLLVTLYDYPGVTVNMHCNQNNAAGDVTIFYGKEATMTINGDYAHRRSAGYAPAAGGILAESGGRQRQDRNIWTIGMPHIRSRLRLCR